MSKMGIGVQLYTLREELQQDFAGTLRQVAQMGYEGVEFAGYGDMAADELKALLEELNLTAIGSHVGLKLLDEDAEGQIAYLKTIGAKYGIVPHVAQEDRQTPEEWQLVFDKLAKYGELFRAHGLQLGYHNHQFEFEMEKNGEFVFDAMFTQIPAEQLFVEMDLGWVQYAKQDPVAYIAKYKGRLPLVHLKDYRAGQTDYIDTVELGEGDLDLPVLIEAAEGAGVEWIIVEQDRCANPPLASVRTSRQWLQANYR